MKTKIVVFLLLLLLPSLAFADIPLAQFEQNMLVFGQKNCDYLSDGTADDAHQMAEYYDAMRVLFLIGDYTKDPKWYACAATARKDFRDYYIIPNNGAVPGYWNHAKGLAEDWLRNKDATSKTAVHLLATNGAWCVNSAYNAANLPDPEQERENALCAMTLIDDYRVGNGLDPRVASQFLPNALLHLQRQFGTKDVPHVKPFMVALAIEFLSRYYYEVTPDPRILPAVKTAADGLWANFWVDSSQAMLYIDHQIPGDDPSAPAPDLNLLIAPIYGFLYKETGDATQKTRGDALFAGGVAAAFLGNGKQFDQNYRSSIDYVKWTRPTPTVMPTSTSTATPVPTKTPVPTATPTRTPPPKPTFMCSCSCS
jgi:hypothetical protein